MTTPDPLAKKILHAVWMAILLGIVVQLIVMLAAGAWPKNPVAETAQKISWSVVVCSALAIGNVLSKAKPLVVGLVGLLAAPVAFHTARTVQKSLSQGLSGGSSSGVPSISELAIAKAIQYALFGFALALASKRGTLRRHLAVGTIAGIAMSVYLSLRMSLGNDPAPTTSSIIPKAVNELVFPIGCAFVLWATTQLGRRLSGEQAAASPATPANPNAAQESKAPVTPPSPPLNPS